MKRLCSLTMTLHMTIISLLLHHWTCPLHIQVMNRRATILFLPKLMGGNVCKTRL
ncbi:hypothetical protein ACB092_08G093600 [Castanea dentata]